MKQKSSGKVFLMEQILDLTEVHSAALGLEGTRGAGSHQEWIIPESTSQGHHFQSQPCHTVMLQSQESALVIETQNELSGNTEFKPTWTMTARALCSESFNLPVLLSAGWGQHSSSVPGHCKASSAEIIVALCNYRVLREEIMEAQVNFTFEWWPLSLAGVLCLQRHFISPLQWQITHQGFTFCINLDRANFWPWFP